MCYNPLEIIHRFGIIIIIFILFVIGLITICISYGIIGWKANRVGALPLSYCRNSYGVAVVKIDKNHKRNECMQWFTERFVLLCFYLRQQASGMVNTRRQISVIIEWGVIILLQYSDIPYNLSSPNDQWQYYSYAWWVRFISHALTDLKSNCFIRNYDVVF